MSGEMKFTPDTPTITKYHKLICKHAKNIANQVTHQKGKNIDNFQTRIKLFHELFLVFIYLFFLHEGLNKDFSYHALKNSQQFLSLVLFYFVVYKLY